jgi:hypothetical protein
MGVTMRLTLLLALLTSLTVGAQPRRPGTSLGNSKDDEEPRRPALPATPGHDVGLLRAILFATEPNPMEVRTLAIEDLGLFGDARALNVLAQMVFDPNPAVWAAALRAIGAIRHPRAEEILSNVIRHPTLSEGHKLRALEYLPFQNTPGALRFIANVPRTPTVPLSVQNLARRILLELPLSRGGTQ